MTRVLLAEDDAAISEPLARALRREGYEVTVRADGPGALLAGQSGVDLVVLDLGLPGMDGLEVCRNVRALSLEAQPIMVALTGWGREDDRRRTHEAGFDQHLVKPVAAEHLRHVLRGVTSEAT